MPTAFAHALVGATIARLGPRTRLAVPPAIVLAGLAAAPDLDVLAFSLGIPYQHPLGHRGLSHSLPFAACVALASVPVWRHWLGPDGGRWRTWALLTFLAVASHGFLDAFTDAGLGIGFFIPFESSRYFFPWRPVATSPLSIGAFFSSGAALTILASELFWIGLPTAAAVGALGLVRRLRGAGREAD